MAIGGRVRGAAFTVRGRVSHVEDGPETPIFRIIEHLTGGLAPSAYDSIVVDRFAIMTY
jgi:hypothetical protein